MKIKDIDKGFSKIIKEIASWKNTKVKIGLFKEEGKNDGEYIADYAYANEFGEGNVPSRPFIRNTFDENQSDWSDSLQENLGKVIEGKIDSNNIFSLLGERAVDDVKKTISNNLPPPNAESTIKKKGSSKTLIDSGAMRNAVSYRITK